MGESVDPKKVLLPYLQRADELQKHEPLVAYYCRLYAMERGLKIPAKERGKVINGLLVSLMSQLEKDKKVIKVNPDDSMHLEGFALSVFAKADKQDRAGRADLNTAKTFYAASIFFEILHQFGEIPPDIEQKQKYAIWKAADIRKALGEGRKPTAGPPGGDEEYSELDQMTWDTEVSTQKSKINPAAVAPDVPQFQPGSPPTPPPASSNHLLPGSDPLPRTSSFESLPRPPSTSPHPHAPHHTRTFSSEDIDLPSAPSQPIYPGNHSASPPRYHSDFPTNYSSTHYSGQDSGAPPPPIHDWSGSRSHVADRPGEPPNSSPYNYPTNSHDDYNSTNFSPYPSNSSHHTPSVYPTEQGTIFSQYSAPPSHYSDYQPGAYPSAAPSQPAYPTTPTTQTSYPAVAPSHDSYLPAASTPGGYPEPEQQHQTSSAPPVAQTSSGYSNAPYLSASSYQPTPDKVADAHKAARFAVSALAFDDVPTAIEYLRKCMDLLTVPSSQAH